MTTNFEDIMAPLGGDSFVKDYLGKKPLHLEGGAGKFAHLMNWQVLNALLGASTIWSAKSLVMVLDKETVPPSDYATVAPGRDGGQVLRPDPLKVKSFLQQGATLVANDIDQLTPELNGFCKVLENAVGGKVQANLYLSSKRKQGFKVHYDTHDVFAVHCEGEKVWHVFEGCADAPIAHDIFKSQPQSHHDQAKGELWKEVRLKPGDLLYLPRGQYHYALADDGGCIHIAFGVTYPIGLDVMSHIYEHMIVEPLGRRNLPQNDDEALRAHLQGMGERAKAIFESSETFELIKAFQKGYRYTREPFDLPDLLEPSRVQFDVSAQSVQLVEQGGRYGLVRKGEQRAVEVPKDVSAMVKWVLARNHFSRIEFDQAFPNAPVAALNKFIDDMMRMGLLRISL